MAESPATNAWRLDTPRIAVVALLFAFSMLSYFDRTILSIAGPQMIKDFGLTPTAMGSIYSAFILGYALFMIPCGHLTDLLGPRLTLTLMGLLSALFTLLIVGAGRPGLGAVIGIVPALFTIRFGLGVVTAPLYPACARMTANWIPFIYHARVQALVMAGSSLGAAIAPVLFTWMLMQFRWRWSFTLAAAATAVVGVCWYWYARDCPSGATRSPVIERKAHRASWARLFADRNLVLLTFAYATLGYFQYIFFYWIFYYFGEIQHLNAKTSARYTTILFLTEGAIMPLGGLLSDRLTRIYGAQFGRRVVPIVGVACTAVLTYAATVSSTPVTVLAFLSLALGLSSCCEGPFWALVTEIGKDHVGGAGSVLNTGAQVGGFFAPILTPYIASMAGWSWGLYAGSLIVVSGAIAVYFVKVPTGTGAPYSTLPAHTGTRESNRT
jgi:ACS family glucarate transporter-like MFS transporter